MLEIIPAILEVKPERIIKQLDLILPHVNVVQLDLCDGNFVKDVTWPFSYDLSFNALHTLQAYMQNLQLDIMAKEYNPRFMNALYPQSALIHWNSFNENEVGSLQFETLQTINGLGLAVPATLNQFQIERVVEFLHNNNAFTYIQVMGIAVRGRQGQKWYPAALDVVKAFKKLLPHMLIQMDGAMNFETIPLAHAAGVERFVVGSALFGVSDPVTRLKELQNIVI